MKRRGGGFGDFFFFFFFYWDKKNIGKKNEMICLLLGEFWIKGNDGQRKKRNVSKKKWRIILMKIII